MSLFTVVECHCLQYCYTQASCSQITSWWYISWWDGAW